MYGYCLSFIANLPESAKVRGDAPDSEDGQSEDSHNLFTLPLLSSSPRTTFYYTDILYRVLSYDNGISVEYEYVHTWPHLFYVCPLPVVVVLVVFLRLFVSLLLNFNGISLLTCSRIPLSYALLSCHILSLSQSYYLIYPEELTSTRRPMSHLW